MIYIAITDPNIEHVIPARFDNAEAEPGEKDEMYKMLRTRAVNELRQQGHDVVESDLKLFEADSEEELNEKLEDACKT